MNYYTWLPCLRWHHKPSALHPIPIYLLQSLWDLMYYGLNQALYLMSIIYSKIFIFLRIKGLI